MEKYLISVYGEDVLEKMVSEIEELKTNSNIPFDKKYVNLGLSFCGVKAKQIVDGEIEKCSLRALVSESFGEAAMYKYNCCNGVL